MWVRLADRLRPDELRPDYENVRAALAGAAEADQCAGLRLLAATGDLFQNIGQADGRRIAQLLLERCPARDRDRVEVLITAGVLAMVTANAEASLAYHSEARELAAELGEDVLPRSDADPQHGGGARARRPRSGQDAAPARGQPRR